MANFIPEKIIDEILDRVDIVEVISGYFPLKRAGRNFKTLCPFHGEKTASFMVSPTKQIFHCFGCFPSGSLIKTEAGFHKIEDVQVGQLVLTHRSRFMPVIRTLWRPYNGKVLKIHTRESNLPVILTADHEVFVMKTKNCQYESRRNKICQWRCKLNCPAKFFNEYRIEKLPAHQLSINDYLLYPINQKTNDVKFIDLDKYYDRKVSNFGPEIKPIPTKIKIDEKFLKLIGYWIAEGSNHRAYIRFSLGESEKEFAKEIEELIKTIFHLKTSIHIRKGLDRTGLEITTCNSKLSNIFENLCGKGAENKRIPFKLQNLSPQKQKILLDAIFKGDGSIGKVAKSKKDRKFKTIKTISLVLAEQLKDILLRLGISPSFRFEDAKVDKKNTRHKTAYTVSWQQNIKLHFSDVVQRDGVFYQILPIKKIVKKGFVGDVYNLTVAKDHSYTTPNFVVGNCGVGGNVFNFIMKHERMEFPEAVKELAQRAGVEIPAYSRREASAEGSLTAQLYHLNTLISQYYHQVLLKQESAKRARNYFAKRGLSDREISKFKLGFAPGAVAGLLNFVSQHQIKGEALQKTGVVLQREDGSTFDRFRNRIIFPIFNSKAKVIGFGGRVLDDSMPKYVNSPETAVYSKGNELYGLNFAGEAIRRKNYLVIVEGYLDLITCHQHGIENTVACLGTALTPEQVRLLKRYARNVLVIYDGDRAGELASLRGLDLLIQESINIKIVNLPSGFDPDDYIRKQGVEKLKKKIVEASDLFDYKLSLLTSKFNAQDTLGKVKIIAEMLPTISKIENSVLKSEYIKKLSESLSVKEEALWIELDKAAKKTSRSADSFFATPAPINVNIRPAEKIIVGLLFDEDKGVLQEIKSRLKPEEFASPQITKLVSHIYELDFNKEEKPLSKLINRLADNELVSLVTEILAGSESIVDKQKSLNDCIRRIKEDSRKQRLASLQSQIKSFQTAGDEIGVARLVSEYNDLIKRRN